MEPEESAKWYIGIKK